MEIKWLKTFALASDLLNYRKTAEQLYITQPAVSLHIKQLEEELNEKLFTKKGRGLLLTEFGRQFRMEAAEMIDHYESMLHRVKSFQQGYRKTLRIGMTPLLVDSVFPSIIRRFTEHHPALELAITVAESEEFQSLVKRDVLDLAFSCLPARNSSLYCEELFSDSVSLVTAHDGLDLESAPALDWEALLNQSIIFTDHHPGYWDTLKRNIQERTTTHRFLKISQSHAAKRFILEGMGVSFFPAFAVRRELLEGRMITVDTPSLSLPVCTIYTVYKYSHSFETELLNFTRQFFMG